MARIDYIPISEFDQLNLNERVLLNLDELARELKIKDTEELVSLAADIALANSAKGYITVVCRDSCDPRKARKGRELW
jgi:hypothetical protein